MNDFVTEEVVMFDKLIAGFNDNNVTAKQVAKFKMPDLAGARTGNNTTQQIFRPLDYRGVTKRGRVLVDADFGNRTQLSVPSSLNFDDGVTSDLISDSFTMNAIELNDPLQRDRIITASVQKLSSELDISMSSEIANKGSLVVTDSAVLTKYSQVTPAEALMTVRGVPLMDARTIIMNAIDWNGISGDLAQRDAPPTGVSLTAFERSMIPRIATFDSFKANFVPSLDAAAGSGFLVNVAQKFIPTAKDANGNNVDNRTMTLNVDTGTGTEKAGDAFTIAGIFALGKINKQNTQQLQTFRIVAVTTPGTVWEITPPIITNDLAVTPTPEGAELEYANCSTEAANNAVISFINTTNALTNIFFVNESVEIVHGSLAMADMNSGGVSSMRRATDSGIELVLMKQSNINDISTKYRVLMWARGNVLEPEMCGILLGGQA